MDNLWNFLFFTGYLKKVSIRMNEDNEILITLAIPNEEIRLIFENELVDLLNESISSMMHMKTFIMHFY